MIYTIFNGPKNHTANPAAVTTSTSLKTLLQLNPLVPCRLIEWGISFDGSAAATPGYVECIEVDVAATVTALANADITQHDAEAVAFGDPTAKYIDVGTGKTGYTASAEGTITTVRNLMAPQLIAPTNQFVFQFPLGQEPYLKNGAFQRIRVKFGAAINALCHMKVAF